MDFFAARFCFWEKDEQEAKIEEGMLCDFLLYL